MVDYHHRKTDAKRNVKAEEEEEEQPKPVGRLEEDGEVCFYDVKVTKP